jgi:flagellar basal body-associated protein FliL
MSGYVNGQSSMNGESRLTMLVVAVCVVLLVVGFAFSVHVEQGISHAAHIEATQQSPVPIPAALAPAQHKAP